VEYLSSKRRMITARKAPRQRNATHGSNHRWLPGRAHHDLIVVFDDATSEVYDARLVPEESTETVMSALKATVERQGVFCALYADRASHLVYTPVAGAGPDRDYPTQIGRALEQLGVELIAANSPQARGRCERLFGTWQGRLPQELRLKGITDLREANRYLEERFIPHHNRHFTVPAREEGSAFVDTAGADLENLRLVRQGPARGECDRSVRRPRDAMIGRRRTGDGKGLLR
jgi:hypothetical protein